MPQIGLTIQALSRTDHEWLAQVWREYWGAEYIVNRGQIVRPADVLGFCAVEPSGERVGLVTYRIEDDQCEIVTIDAFTQFRGVGTLLLEAVRKLARGEHCRRIWLITTNDNLDALRFYQRRDFHLVAVHRDALDRSRELKPSIPSVRQYNIPLRDELELEILL